MRFSLKVQGGKELAQAIRRLPEAMQPKVVNEALKEGAEPMRSRASQLAPHEPGAPDLRENIGISVISKAGSVGGGPDERLSFGEYGVAVGPTKDFFYGFFQEFGYGPGPVNAFMRPSFDSTAQTSLTIIMQMLWAAIREQADRGRSTTGRGL